MLEKAKKFVEAVKGEETKEKPNTLLKLNSFHNLLTSVSSQRYRHIRILMEIKPERQ